jgi:hypothetical protein
MNLPAAESHNSENHQEMVLGRLSSLPSLLPDAFLSLPILFKGVKATVDDFDSSSGTSMITLASGRNQVRRIGAVELVRGRVEYLLLVDEGVAARIVGEKRTSTAGDMAAAEPPAAAAATCGEGGTTASTAGTELHYFVSRFVRLIVQCKAEKRNATRDLAALDKADALDKTTTRHKRKVDAAKTALESADTTLERLSWSSAKAFVEDWKSFFPAALVSYPRVMRLAKNAIRPKIGRPPALTENQEENMVKTILELDRHGCPLSRSEVVQLAYEVVSKDKKEATFPQGAPGYRWIDGMVERWRGKYKDLGVSWARRGDALSRQPVEILEGDLGQVKSDVLQLKDALNLRLSQVDMVAEDGIRAAVMTINVDEEAKLEALKQQVNQQMAQVKQRSDEDRAAVTAKNHKEAADARARLATERTAIDSALAEVQSMEARGVRHNDVLQLAKMKTWVGRLQRAHRGRYGMATSQNVVERPGMSLCESPNARGSPLKRKMEYALNNGRANAKKKAKRKLGVSDNAAGGIMSAAGTPEGTSTSFIQTVGEAELSRDDAAAKTAAKDIEYHKQNEEVKKKALAWLDERGTGEYREGLKVVDAKRWLKEELAVAHAEKDMALTRLLEVHIGKTKAQGFWNSFKEAVRAVADPNTLADSAND